MKTRTATLNPVLRAVIAKRWTQTAVEANIHALIGADSDKLVNNAGSVFFVVLGAAIEAKIPPDQPDVSILRGAVNAVYDQAGESEIDETRRHGIISGLQAAKRIAAMVPYPALVKSACDLHLKLKTGHVMYNDFARL